MTEQTTDPRHLGVPAGASEPDPGRRRIARLAAVAALVVALVVLLVVLFTGGGSTTYKLSFSDAGQLVKGDVVRIGGTTAGTIKDIELTGDSRAMVTISLNDQFAPLHRGTTAVIRSQSLIGVANRYIDVSPGPNFREALADGATLATDKNTTIVDLDQVFNTLDPKTRRGLQGLIKGSASWYRGREALANQSAKYFAPAFGAADRLVREVDRDSVTFQRFLVNTSKAMGTIAQRRQQLTDLVSNTSTTTRALGQHTASLDQALTQLPPALRKGSDTFVGLRPAIADLQRLTDTTGPATKDLAPFLRRLQPVTAQAAPRFGQLRTIFDRPGKGNDLYDALLDLPTIGRQASTYFPRARKALRGSTPIFGFGRPYTPDLTAFISSFGRAAAPYDFNSHYVRTLPVFNAFDFKDDANGGTFTAKGLESRGQSPFLKTGNLRRCPGAGERTPDNSSNFVDIGALANADCDPSQKVGG